MKRKKISLLLAALLPCVVHELPCFGLSQQRPKQGAKWEAAKELQADARLKAGVTTDFQKPKVRDVLDILEKATGLKFADNNKIEPTQESFGSLSFRNTPAWAVMAELAKSKAVQGSWAKTADGYMLIGTLDSKAQEDRVETVKKMPNFAARPIIEPRESSLRIWIFAAILTSVAAGAAVILVVRQRRKRTAAKELPKQ